MAYFLELDNLFLKFNWEKNDMNTQKRLLRKDKKLFDGYKNILMMKVKIT